MTLDRWGHPIRPKKEAVFSVSFNGENNQKALEVLCAASGQNRTYWCTKIMDAFFADVDVAALASEYAEIESAHQNKINDLLNRVVFKSK